MGYLLDWLLGREEKSAYPITVSIDEVKQTEPPGLYKIKAFPRNYQDHADHDVLLVRMTRGDLEYSLKTSYAKTWYFLRQDGFDGVLVWDNYRSVIIEKVDENDGDSSLQYFEPTAARQTEDQGCDTRDRRGTSSCGGGAGSYQGDPEPPKRRPRRR